MVPPYIVPGSLTCDLSGIIPLVGGGGLIEGQERGR